MKPFVAIDGVLDYLLFIFFRCISVEDCAKSEIACSAYGPVRGPGTFRTGQSFLFLFFVESAHEGHGSLF